MAKQKNGQMNVQPFVAVDEIHQIALRLLQEKWTAQRIALSQTEAQFHAVMRAVGLDPAKNYEMTTEGQITEKVVG